MESESAPELSEIIFLGACIVGAAYMHYESLSFSPEASVFPRVASTVVGIGATLLLIRYLLPERIQHVIESGNVLDEDLAADAETEAEPNDRYMAYVAGLTIAYVIVGYLIGLLWATPMLVVIYGELFDVQRKITAALTAIGFGITYAFMAILNLSIETGILTEGFL